MTDQDWGLRPAGGQLVGTERSPFALASTGTLLEELTVVNGSPALAAVAPSRWRPVLAALMCLFSGFVRPPAAGGAAEK